MPRVGDASNATAPVGMGHASAHSEREGKAGARTANDWSRGVNRGDVSAAIDRLSAAPAAHGAVYNASSHAYLMVRDSATQELGLEASRDVDALNQLLLQMQDTSSVFIMEQAAKAAGGAAMDNDMIFEEILHLLEHEHHDVRRAALIAIKERLRSERVMAAAQEAHEGRVKEFDREIEAIARVRQAVHDVNGRVRFSAIDSLAELVGKLIPDAIASANEVLKDDEEWVRRTAAELLGRALAACQDFHKTLSPVALPNVKEGFNDLIGSGIRCYDVGLTLKGGGDPYMRRIAVIGLCVVASSEGVIQYDDHKEGDHDDEAFSVDDDDAHEWKTDQEGAQEKVKKEPKVYYTPQHAIDVLTRALADDVEEIRQIASKTLMDLAAQNNRHAIDAVMCNVDTIITDGLGKTNFGQDGTPEYLEWTESLENTSWEALQASVHSAEESHKAWLEQKMEEERRRQIDDTILAIEEAVTAGDFEVVRDYVFPQSETLENIKVQDLKDVEMRQIRSCAAHGLQQLASRGHVEASRVFASNYDTLLDLCGLGQLGLKTAELVKQQKEVDDALLPKAQPALISRNEAVDLSRRLLAPGDEKGRCMAAATLSKLAEMGDSEAATVIIQNAQAYLVAMQAAKLFNSKIINNGEALRRTEFEGMPKQKYEKQNRD